MKKIVLALSVLLVGQAYAVSDAGCGLGSIVWEGKNGKLSNILAVTTNGTFGSQTFGITTGTSNCKADGIVKNEVEKEYFANSNLNMLIEEMAQGQGEHLSAMAHIYGCQGQAVSQFSASAQQNFNNIVDGQMTGAKLIQNMNRVVGSGCQI